MAASKKAAARKAAGTRKSSGGTRPVRAAKPAAKRATSAASGGRRSAAAPPARRVTSAAAEREAAFEALRAILMPFGRKLHVVADGPNGLHVDAGYSAEFKRDVFFGAVRVSKSYVSYHLMPVYVFPELLKGSSRELRASMQGKSCFNFTAPDRALFAELKALTAAGYDLFKKAGLA